MTSNVLQETVVKVSSGMDECAQECLRLALSISCTLDDAISENNARAIKILRKLIQPYLVDFEHGSFSR